MTKKKNAKDRRDRGRLLTDAGLKKIWTAIYTVLPDRQTFKAIAQYTDHTVNPQATVAITAETIAKILKRSRGVDLSTLENLFTAFEVELQANDYRSANSLSSYCVDPNFVGRQKAISDLRVLMQQNSKVVVIQAPSGMGKTTLAQSVLRQAFDTVIEFPIGIDINHIAPADSWLTAKLQQLGEETGTDGEFLVLCDRFKQKLQASPIGILMDNLETALNAKGHFITAHRRYVELLRVLTDPSVQSTTFITSCDSLLEPKLTPEKYVLPALDITAWQQFFHMHHLMIETPIERSILERFYYFYGGNARHMKKLSKAILNDFGGDIVAYWQSNYSDRISQLDTA